MTISELEALRLEMRAGFAETRASAAEQRASAAEQRVGAAETRTTLNTLIDAIADLRREYADHTHPDTNE